MRDRRTGIFSIECIFNAVCSALGDKIEFEHYIVDSHKSKLHNIISVSSIRADVYHITGDCNYMALGLPRHKTILTVHDIGHYENTLNGIKRWLFGLFWWRLPLWWVKHLTVISNFTTEKIVDFFGVTLKKVSIIYNPIFSGFNVKTTSFNTTNPRILQVGSGHNKNVDRLIKAVKGIDCTLVMVNRLSSAVIEELERHNIKYEMHVNLTNEQMQMVYSSCDLLYFASLYEGFGLPIIEAQASGIPVITSNLASMPEVAGEGALLVNPLDIDQIRQAIIQLMNDEELRSSLVEKGLVNVKRFQLSKIAKAYLELYLKVAG